MSNHWNQREKHVGTGNSAVPPFRPCMRPQSHGERPQGMPPATAVACGPAEPWFAMDEDLFVRRVNGHFSGLTRGPTVSCVGHPLFAVLAHLGVNSRALDEVYDKATTGETCLLELPRGSLGHRYEECLVEIRPIPARAGWVIRYVAIAWRLGRDSLENKAVPALAASPLEFSEFEGSPSCNRRPGSGRSLRPGSN